MNCFFVILKCLVFFMQARGQTQWGPEGWGPKPRKSGGPKGGGPKFRVFFSPLPPDNSFFSSLSGGSSRGISVMPRCEDARLRPIRLRLAGRNRIGRSRNWPKSNRWCLTLFLLSLFFFFYFVFTFLDFFLVLNSSLFILFLCCFCFPFPMDPSAGPPPVNPSSSKAAQMHSSFTVVHDQTHSEMENSSGALGMACKCSQRFCFVA